MDDLIQLQKNSILDVNTEIDYKRKVLEELKVSYSTNYKELGKKFQKYKENTLKDIENKKDKKANSLIKENYLIKVVLALDVIQK